MMIPTDVVVGVGVGSDWESCEMSDESQVEGQCVSRSLSLASSSRFPPPSLSPPLSPLVMLRAGGLDERGRRKQGGRLQVVVVAADWIRPGVRNLALDVRTGISL